MKVTSLHRVESDEIKTNGPEKHNFMLLGAPDFSLDTNAQTQSHKDRKAYIKNKQKRHKKLLDADFNKYMS